MSKDKYTSVFSRQKEAIVFIIKYIPSNICDAGKKYIKKIHYKKMFTFQYSPV